MSNRFALPVWFIIIKTVVRPSLLTFIDNKPDIICIDSL